jgi:hypothetical protein
LKLPDALRLLRPILLGILSCCAACKEECQKNGGQLLALKTLREIVDAQEEFRQRDLDENNQLDYWRKDIAGLYFLPHNEGQIRLIRLSTALADKAPVVIPPSSNKERTSQAGYWFEAIAFEGETELKRDVFAVQATPDSTSPEGSLTFIADKDHIYQKNVQRIPLKRWPIDPVKDGWTLVR